MANKVANSQEVIVSIDDFRTLARKTRGELLSPTAGFDAQNVRFTEEYGSIEKRKSRSLYGSMSSLGTSRVIFIDRFYRSAIEIYTKLLTHADGDNGSLLFYDESGKTVVNPKTVLDLMEYSTDALAQETYVSNSGYSLDLTSGGTAIMSSATGGTAAADAFDDNSATFWLCGEALGYIVGYSYIGYDFGSGVTKTIEHFTIQQKNQTNQNITSVILQYGDDNDDDITRSDFTWSSLEIFTIVKDFTVQSFDTSVTSSPHRYWRLLANSSPDTQWGVAEVEFMEKTLQCFSDGIIKTEGSYSLRVKAYATLSLNYTLTYTLDDWGFDPIDLSGVSTFKYDQKALRTGSNIKITLHNSNGNTIDSTHNQTADVFESVSMDISGVADADKDAIDSIIITVMDASSDNLVYIDNMYAGTPVVVDTTHKKFGTGSAYFTKGSYLYIGDSSDWYFADQDFTVDLWVYFSSLTDAQVICGQYQDSDNYWYLKKDTSANDNKLSMVFKFGGTVQGSYVMVGAWSGVSTSTWYHLEFSRNLTTGLIFIGGVSQTLTETVAFSTNDVGDITGNLIIGQQNFTDYFQGNMDELRISKGIIRHTANFTPPISAYANTVNSKYLLCTYEDTLKISDDVAGNFANIQTGLTSGIRWKSLTYKSHWYGCNGQDNNVVYNGINVETMGIPVPTAPTVSLVSNGVLSGSYYYKVTYEIDNYQEGSASVASDIITPSDQKVTVTIPISSNSRVTARNIYRTQAGGSILYFLTRVSNNGDTTYLDNNADTALDTTIPASIDNDAPPTFKYICLHQSRIFGARLVDNVSRTVYSDIVNGMSLPDVFPADNFFDTIKDNGEDVTAILEDNYGQFMVFKPSAVVRINTDTDDPVGWSGFDKVLSINGCIAPYTAVKTSLGIIYLTRYAEGKKCLMLWNGSSTTPIFNELEPLLSSISEDRVLDMVAQYHNGAYNLSYSDSTDGNSYNDRVLSIDLTTGAWSIDKKNVDCFSSWTSGIVGVSGADKGELYTSTSDNTGLIHHEDTSDAPLSESTIEMYYLSQWLDFGWVSPYLKRVRKNMFQVRIDFERVVASGNLTFSYYINNSSSPVSKTFDFFTYATKGFVIYQFPIGTYCKNIQYELYHADDVSELKIKGIHFSFSPEPNVEMF